MCRGRRTPERQPQMQHANVGLFNWAGGGGKGNERRRDEAGKGAEDNFRIVGP